MKFQFTPEEAQPFAESVVKYLQRNKLKVSIEVPAWPDAGWRTTLLGRQTNLLKLIEVQSALSYSKPLKDFALWIAAKRHYAELSIAVPSDATLQAGTLQELQRDWVGLLVVDEDGTVRESIRPKNPALIVTPDPNLKFGKCKQEVTNAITKFNETDRKDGLRDMCELVERETEALALLASKKGLLTLAEAIISGKDWSNQINILASTSVYTAGHSALIENKLKDDMHSFRGARNLIDHKASNKKAERERQLQFAERMMQGPRLLAKLVSLQRKIR